MMSKSVIAPLLNAFFLAILLSFSHGLLKWLSTRAAGSYWQAALQYWWILGGAMGIYAFIFFYYAYILKYISISILYPVYTGLSIVLVSSMGVWFFNESWNWQHIAGCALIIAGIFMVSGIRG